MLVKNVNVGESGRKHYVIFLWQLLEMDIFVLYEPMCNFFLNWHAKVNHADALQPELFLKQKSVWIGLQRNSKQAAQWTLC